MTIQTQEIRRRTNGTIDIDHYRDQALSLRRQSTCNMMRGVPATSWALFGAAAPDRRRDRVRPTQPPVAG